MDNEKLPAILFSADGFQILHGGGINSGRSYGKTYAMERWKNLQESEPIIIGMDFNQEPSRTIITKLNVEGDVITPEEMPHMENVVKTVTVEDVGDRKMITMSIEGDMVLMPLDDAENVIRGTLCVGDHPVPMIIECAPGQPMPDHARQLLQEAEAEIFKSWPEGSHVAESGQAKQLDNAAVIAEVARMYDDLKKPDTRGKVSKHRYGKGIPQKSWRRKKNLRNIQRRSRKANRS